MFPPRPYARNVKADIRSQKNEKKATISLQKMSSKEFDKPRHVIF